MGRSRMFTNEDPDVGKNRSQRTTIVGAQPPKDTGSELPPVPTGIQTLLRLAAVDEGFRQRLIDKRGEIAGAADVPLNSTEAKILSAISKSQLEAMIRSMPPPAEDRRSFLRQTAASAVILLGGAGLAEATSSCKADQPGAKSDAGVSAATEEDPIERPNHKDMETEGGAAPDEPPVRPDKNEMPSAGGVAPDEPPPRPNAPTPPTGIAPDMPPPKTRGHAADLPPPRPDHADTRTKGGSEPDVP